MLTTTHYDPIDYLVVGHLTQDLTPDGPRLGGTAAYSALAAHALGLRVGIVTACNPKIDLSILAGIPIALIPSDVSTTFENITTSDGRIQYLYSSAPVLDATCVPQTWKNTPIVHLGPVAQEVDPTLPRLFENSLIGLTPQGWLRSWDQEGRVSACEWPEASFVLERATAAVLSIEDVQRNEERIEEMVTSIRILVVTEGAQGSRLYWNGDLRRFRPPQMVEVDSVGAGDIFAAAFFARLQRTRDPWEAARYATSLAAASVTRPGLQGIPLPAEVEAAANEIITTG